MITNIEVQLYEHGEVLPVSKKLSEANQKLLCTTFFTFPSTSKPSLPCVHLVRRQNVLLGSGENDVAELSSFMKVLMTLQAPVSVYGTYSSRPYCTVPVLVVPSVSYYTWDARFCGHEFSSKKQNCPDLNLSFQPPTNISTSR